MAATQESPRRPPNLSAPSTPMRRKLPTRRLPLFVAGIILGAALAAGWFLWHRRHRPIASGPLAVSLWYWRQPFRIPPADAPILREMGVNTLFVRAGTITRDSETGALRMILPQVWTAPPEGIGVHLVFNADYGVVRHLDTLTDDALHAAFAGAIRDQWARAIRAGVPVVGVQLDFDLPTRLLPRYATLLASLRRDLRGMGAGKYALSITTLPTWLTNRGFDAVAGQVDFFAPQFYEAVIPQTFAAASSDAGFETIGDEARLRRGLDRAGRQRAIFWTGLPAYGHALVYDGKGKLRGTFHDASVLDMLHQPYFRLARTYPAGAEGSHAPAPDAAHFGGEEIVDLEPTGVGAPDQTNFHLIYDLPTATLVARQLAIVRANRPVNCQGVILFRYPEADATQSVPLPALRAVWRGATPPVPHLKVLISSRPIAPWRAIEGGAEASDGAARNLFVTVTDDGAGAAGVAPDAVDVVVRFNHACLRGTGLAPGGFDQIVPFASAPNQRSTVARAEGIRLQALHFAPGESRTSGPISVTADGAVTIGAWRATGDGGFAVVTGQFNLTRSAGQNTGQNRR